MYEELDHDDKLSILRCVLTASPESAYKQIVLVGLAPDVLAIGKALHDDPALGCGISPWWIFKGPWVVGCAWHDECYLEEFAHYFRRSAVDFQFLQIQKYVAARTGRSNVKPYAQYAIVRALGRPFYEGPR